MLYYYREIGESTWLPCTESWYNYCDKSPEHETSKTVNTNI